MEGTVARTRSAAQIKIRRPCSTLSSRTLSSKRSCRIRWPRSYYEHLAREVDVQASDAAEQVTVTRNAVGTTLVEVRTLDVELDNPESVFSGRFDPSDSRGLRVYLRGGDDRVKVIGEPGRIVLRVIAGDDGQKRLDDGEGGGTRLYEEFARLQTGEATASSAFAINSISLRPASRFS